jgi:hypothetical protein
MDPARLLGKDPTTSVSDPNVSGLRDPDPFVRGMDPRIRIGIQIHTKMSWICSTAATTDINEVVSNTDFVSAEISYCSKANLRKRKKQKFSITAGFLRIKTRPGSGWKNNKYEKQQLFLANGLGHVEGSLHQLEGGVL